MVVPFRNLFWRPKHRRRSTSLPPIPGDIAPTVAETIQRVQPFTLTSPERVAALCDAVAYVVRSDIPGAIVECGVWRGGSMMAVAYTLLQLNHPNRELYLFDTYEGMSPPGPHDRDFNGTAADELLARQSRDDPKSLWCRSPLAEVQANLAATCYPDSMIHYVKGRVEDTVPAAAPQDIAILRLDTDWYESTRHELGHLFPRLRPGGVLIVDDYGHWHGARRAVEEYLGQNKIPILLNRIDYTGRIGVLTMPHPQGKATR
jgi:hypothetical protein